MTEPVYLDYAATSAVRPPEVAGAVAGYLRDVGATPGRAGHARALDAGRLVLRCRRALCDLFRAPGDPGRMTLQPSATWALNTALFGLLRPGDAVVRTAYDHNAVRRPVAALRARGVEERVLPGRPDGGLELERLAELLSLGGRPARLLVVTHASNVLGSVLPLREMAARARAAGALVLVDAAQSAGHLPLDVEDAGVDLLAFSGHKGLLGPQGVGGLWVREGVEVAPLGYGGTGGDSEQEAMPATLPDRLEPGSLNAPGIAGLLAGVEWLRARGVEALHSRAMELKALLRERAAAVRGVRLRSPAAPDGTALVTLTSDRMTADELARRLDREHGVLARAGLHCAPEAHALLGTEAAGAVRLSIGWATTEADVRRAAAALAAIHQHQGEGR